MAIRQFIVGPFSTIQRFGDMVALATLFTFTGLCMCFMYAVNKFNLSAEGIVIISGCMTTYLGIQLQEFQGNPASRSTADLHPDWDGGSRYPGCFKCQVRRPCGRGIADAELHIILPVSIHFEVWYERRLHAEPRFSQISGRAEAGRSCPETEIHAGLIIAAVCVVLVVIAIYKTPFCYAMRTVGSNPNFAKYAGISVTGTVVAAQIIGGAFAGLGGAVEILGRYERFRWLEMPNYGFDGLIVAVMAPPQPGVSPSWRAAAGIHPDRG